MANSGKIEIKVKANNSSFIRQLNAIAFHFSELADELQRIEIDSEVDEVFE